MQSILIVSSYSDIVCTEIRVTSAEKNARKFLNKYYVFVDKICVINIMYINSVLRSFSH